MSGADQPNEVSLEWRKGEWWDVLAPAIEYTVDKYENLIRHSEGMLVVAELIYYLNNNAPQNITAGPELSHKAAETCIRWADQAAEELRMIERGQDPDAGALADLRRREAM